VIGDISIAYPDLFGVADATNRDTVIDVYSYYILVCPRNTL